MNNNVTDGILTSLEHSLSSANYALNNLSLRDSIRALFPKRLKVVGTYNRRVRKDGSDFAVYERHHEEYPEVRDNGDGTYSTLDWFEFNIGSSPQRVERLLELGWEPQDFTEEASPKLMKRAS